MHEHKSVQQKVRCFSLLSPPVSLGGRLSMLNDEYDVLGPIGIHNNIRDDMKLVCWHSIRVFGPGEWPRSRYTWSDMIWLCNVHIYVLVGIQSADRPVFLVQIACSVHWKSMSAANAHTKRWWRAHRTSNTKPAAILFIYSAHTRVLAASLCVCVWFNM